ncbi:hypothetical protein QBC34DRAFT_184856 [Podospora aff. communis PSN243]|uniref:BTB domain-containing protein n=1 Tax=Podospora aff. communis PSN243 TaxID=3040156 RepID=A0AAV9G6W1_9PEZI|nr:hypothetical protein QBC34DRAFT_184856 [Podospora aff. communis PSN243]
MSSGSRLFGNPEFEQIVPCWDSWEVPYLKLVCQSREFLVPRGCVCRQSPVMAAAVRRPLFQEATSNVIQVERFNVETVESMVEFFYTGDYDILPLAGNSEDHLLLLRHLRVGIIADHYDIQNLATLVNHNIKALDPSKTRNPHVLLQVVEEMASLTSELTRDLSETIAALVAQNITLLSLLGRKSPLVLSLYFGNRGVRIIQQLANKVENLERDLKLTTDRLEASVQTEERLKARDTKAPVREGWPSRAKNVRFGFDCLGEKDRCLVGNNGD